MRPQPELSAGPSGGRGSPLRGQTPRGWEHRRRWFQAQVYSKAIRRRPRPLFADMLSEPDSLCPASFFFKPPAGLLILVLPILTEETEA